MVRRDEYTLVEMISEGANEQLRFNKERGFALAATIIYGDLALDAAPLEDPEIGQLKFVMKSWSESEVSEIFFTELSARKCSDEDLSVGESQTRNEYGFYQFEQNTRSYLELMKGRMYCIDDYFEILGHYNSFVAQNLMVVYEKCDASKRKCKSPQEIYKALQFSYIFLVQNTMSYKHQEEPGSEQSFIKHANFKWYALSTDVRQDFPKMIT